MRVFKAVLLAVPLLLLASSMVLAGQVANYELQNSLASSDGNSASLVDLGTGSFVTDTVAGQQCTVFDFAEQTGLSLDITGLFGSSAYSFVAMMRFSETSNYAKILDVRNRNIDEGLYAYQSGLVYYDYSNNNLTARCVDMWMESRRLQLLTARMSVVLDPATCFSSVMIKIPVMVRILPVG